MKPENVAVLGLFVADMAAIRTVPEPVQNGTFTAPIRGFAWVEKKAFSWYNFDSRQTNLSIRYFNNLKSIRRRSPELGWGGFSKSVFKA